MFKLLCTCAMILLAAGCSKDPKPPTTYRYYEIGLRDTSGALRTTGKDWRDTAFVVAVSSANAPMIGQINAQLALPVDQRKIVNGALAPGNGGYNKNGPHVFKWHFKEDDWTFTDMSIEIYDGRPYSDLDLHYTYWMDTVKRFAPWDGYIKKEITP